MDKGVERKKRVMTNGSLILAEAFVRTGADVFVGYPITPANWLFSFTALVTVAREVFR